MAQHHTDIIINSLDMHYHTEWKVPLMNFGPSYQTLFPHTGLFEYK